MSRAAPAACLLIAPCGPVWAPESVRAQGAVQAGKSPYRIVSTNHLCPPSLQLGGMTLYRAAWDEALRRFSVSALSDDSLSRHAAFIARGRDDPRDVCPRSKEELALANVMVLRAMAVRAP